MIEWRVTNARKKAAGPGGPLCGSAGVDRPPQRSGYSRRLDAEICGPHQRKLPARQGPEDRCQDPGHMRTDDLWSGFPLGNRRGVCGQRERGYERRSQAFKRACSCFGLGRYLYYFTGVWVDLDERKRPKNIPRLFGWATPQGWRQGLRPSQEADTDCPIPLRMRTQCRLVKGARRKPRRSNDVVRQIEAMETALGRRLYRGVLKSGARVWNPTEIRDADVLRNVLEQMQAAERGLLRLKAALNRVEPGTLVPVLHSLGFSSLDQVDSLESLKRVVLEVERMAGSTC